MRTTKVAATFGRGLVLAAFALVPASLGCSEDWDFSFGGASGVGGGGPEVACGTGKICAAGQVCCVSKDGSSPLCATDCDATQATLACSEPAHCAGAQCCLTRSGVDVVGASCQASCATDALEVCPSTANTCSNMGTCAPDDAIGGLFVCLTP